MNNLVLQLRYIGVIPQSGYREYGFHIEDKEIGDRIVILTIEDGIFLRRELMFQEAPDLCYQKLLTDLRSETGGARIPAHVSVSTSDIVQYRDGHPNTKGRTRPGAKRKD